MQMDKSNDEQHQASQQWDEVCSIDTRQSINEKKGRSTVEKHWREARCAKAFGGHHPPPHAHVSHWDWDSEGCLLSPWILVPLHLVDKGRLGTPAIQGRVQRDSTREARHHRANMCLRRRRREQGLRQRIKAFTAQSMSRSPGSPDPFALPALRNSAAARILLREYYRENVGVGTVVRREMAPPVCWTYS